MRTAGSGNRDIIVIGGSSGATGPLRQILASLPGEFPASVFVVLHVPARGGGLLATVAATASRLPVVQAEDGMPIESGHIYIAAPDRHLILTDNRMRMGDGPRENMVRPAADSLFRSAAAAFGSRVIGVVLSGLLNDGAAGLSAIKRCGGAALVQEPSDALASEMPRRALRATVADLCVPGAQLGAALAELVREPAGPSLPVPPELRVEVEIAAGQCLAGDVSRRILSSLDPSSRADISVVQPHRSAAEQDRRIDEALGLALRIIEDRAELVARLAEDGLKAGRGSVAAMFDERVGEYREYANRLREALLDRFEAKGNTPSASQTSDDQCVCRSISCRMSRR